MAGDKNKFDMAMTHARRLSQEGKWNEAMKAYRFALAEFPNDETAIIGFGRAALAGGQPDFAWKAFQHALKANPSNAQALRSVGEIQEQRGEAPAAAEAYLRAGNVLSSNDDLEAAIECWGRAVELIPDHVDARHNLAQALLQRGDSLEAARQYLTLAAMSQSRGDTAQARRLIGKAAEPLPDSPGVLAALEALERGEPIQPEKIDEAPAAPPDTASDFSDEFPESDLLYNEDWLDDISKEFPAEPVEQLGLVDSTQQRALEELANVIFEDESAVEIAATVSREEVTRLIIQAIDLQSREEFTEAISHYRQVVQVGAGRPSLYFNLGFLYKAQRQFEQAAKVLQMAAQDDEYSIGAQFLLGETYYAANNPDLAVRHFVEALKIIDLQTVSGDKARILAEVYENLSDEYLAKNDRAQLDNFVAALQKFFANPEWQNKVYEARQRMNNVAEDGNVMSLAEFLETPETEVVITAIALTSEYLQRNMVMTAAEECLRSIQRAPTYLPLHTRLAEILLRQERTDEAITKYLYIANVYQMRNQSEQAVKIFQKILRLAPMDVTVRSKLIDLYTAHNQVEHALDQYLMLADSYYQLAQVDRALEKYNEALRLSSAIENAGRWKSEILNRMGDIYNQRFDWGRAITAFEELREVKPGDERIQRQLVELYFKRNNVEKATPLLDQLLANYEQQQRPDQVLELLRDLSSLYPDNLSLRKRLAEAYVKNNRRREAIAEYDALGEMQLEKGLRDEARQTIQAIINLGPDDVDGYQRLLAQIGGGAV